jgi:hypothetical protein
MSDEIDRLVGMHKGLPSTDGQFYVVRREDGRFWGGIVGEDRVLRPQWVEGPKDTFVFSRLEDVGDTFNQLVQRGEACWVWAQRGERLERVEMFRCANVVLRMSDGSGRWWNGGGWGDRSDQMQFATKAEAEEVAERFKGEGLDCVVSGELTEAGVAMMKGAEEGERRRVRQGRAVGKGRRRGRKGRGRRKAVPPLAQWLFKATDEGFVAWREDGRFLAEGGWVEGEENAARFSTVEGMFAALSALPDPRCESN